VDSRNGFYFASITHALADPDFYDKDDIALGGFLAGDDSQLFLFLSDAHAQLYDIGSAIRIEVTDYALACSEQYVIVFGTYSFDGTDLPLMSNVKRIQRAADADGIRWLCYDESE
jgi:hypothetical protein